MTVTTAVSSAYYDLIAPLLVILSLGSCTYNLHKIQLRKPVSIFAPRGKMVAGPRAPSRFFDALVKVLVIIQIYMYSMIGLFLPLLWLLPEVVIVGKLQRLGWFYQAGPNHRDNIISFVNHQLIMPAFYLEHFWHGVIAAELCALIVLHKPPQQLHRGLKHAFYIVVGLVTIKWLVELLAIFYPPMARAQYFSSVAMHSSLFLVTAVCYGNVIFSLRVSGPTRSPMIRSIRDRLLTLCTYLMVQLSARATLIGLGLMSHSSPLPLIILSNSLNLLRGFVDSLILGNIFNDMCCCTRICRSKQSLKRQITDNRVRIGSSPHTSDSWTGANSSGSSGGGVRWYPPPAIFCHGVTGSTFLEPILELDEMEECSILTLEMGANGEGHESKTCEWPLEVTTPEVVVKKP